MGGGARSPDCVWRPYPHILLGLLGLFLVIGVVGLALTYWPYFLIAGLLGLAGLYGRWRWRRRKTEGEEPKKEAQKPTRSRIEGEPAEQATRPVDAGEQARQRRARAEAAAAEEAALDEELAAMKARIKDQERVE